MIPHALEQELKFGAPDKQEATQARPRRVFVIEDDVELTTILDRVLRIIDSKVEIDWATSAEEAVARLVSLGRHSDGPPYDLIIADIFLEGPETGLDLWRICSQLYPEVPIVITSAMPVDRFFKAVGPEAVSPPFLPKPFSPQECKQLFQSLFKRGARGLV